jgi:hypothetical protein
LRHARPGECGAVSLSTRVCSSRRTTWPGRDLCLPTALVGFPTLRSLAPAAGVVASPRPTGPRAFSTARPVPRFIFVGDRTALLVAARATSPPANRSTASSSWASGLVSRLRSVSAVVAPGTAAALGFASRRVVGATRHTPFPRTFASPVPGHRFRRLSARGFGWLRRVENGRKQCDPFGERNSALGAATNVPSASSRNRCLADPTCFQEAVASAPCLRFRTVRA